MPPEHAGTRTMRFNRKLSSTGLCLALVMVSCLPLAQAQDRCHGATPIGNGLTSGSNVGATSGASDPVGSCGYMGSDVWYSYQASCTGNVTASLCAPGAGANFDTVLSAWDGSCGCAALVQLACN